jgi:hypothetical protein
MSNDSHRSWMLDQLHAYREARRPGSEALWRMSREERQAAMWRGELTWEQLWEWAAKAPTEVPLINDEFAFIAARTPEVAELHESNDKQTS